MKSGKVLRNGEVVGILTKSNSGKYSFVYEDSWFLDPEKPSVSLTLPKIKKEYHSDLLFPFFFNMVSEGANLRLQAKNFQIDENDTFSILLKTAHTDTIGAITIVEMEP